MNTVVVPFCRIAASISAGAALSACAVLTPPAANPPAAAAAPAAAASGASPFATAPAPRPDPSAPRPFADVIKGATQQAGFVPVWRKDDKLWLEVPAERLDQPFLLTVNISHSVGERGLYASQMGPSWLVAFRKVNNTLIQLVALNTEYIASGAPMKATVEQGFSNSLIASAAIASAPHPERNSVLIDGAFLLSDIAGYSTKLEAAFRMPYALDRANSFFEKTRVADDITTLNARMHYSTARIPAPPLTATAPVAPPPRTTADPRSFFVGYVYSFTKLPEQPMAPRRADPRVGHFTDTVTDLSTDLQANPRVHYVNRWRLEKADPQAALSEPKQPIVFWLDKNIPLEYRKSVEAGVLEWNKAFERIGFRDAIVVRQQPDDADWDDMDARHASIRWFVGADVGFAIGPSHSDPRTGEIIDADIGMSDVFGRGTRRFFVEDVGRGSVAAPAAELVLPGMHNDRAMCTYAQDAAAEMDFALDLVEARGDLQPDSPQTEALVQAVVKDTIMHEVGHVLGLKHNFKSSTVYSRQQLQDPEFTAKHGISGSVMDYTGFNLATSGERQGAYRNSTLGPYDYWAIEYAYKPVAPADEAAELARIASRSTEPWLAFADDGEANDGIDPLVNRFDLGDDPLAYYRKRLQLSRELWQRVQDRPPRPGDDASRQRRVLLSGFSALGRSTELVAKYVGGMNSLRDLPGTTGRAAWQPVAPAKQREALEFISTGLFTADSFRFKPQFLASLAPDYNEWNRGGPVNIPAAVLQLQTVALDRLLSPGTASRLLDLPLYVPQERRKGLISLNEVYGTVQDAVWSELKSGKNIDRLRRNLQREHLKRVQTVLTRSPGSLPADALSLMRLRATELQMDLKRASTHPGLSVETRAHLQDSLAALTEALRASMQRS